MKKELYKVKTFGGQIIDYQEPEKVVINLTPEMLSRLERWSVTWNDEYANYYPTRKNAVRAINAAMCN